MEEEGSNHSYAYYDDYLDDPQTVVISDKLRPLEDEAIRIFLVVVYSVTCFLGVLGNGLVIFIATCKVKKTVNTVWFVNLAIADFLFNLFLPIHIAYVAMDYHWVFGVAMCKVSNFLLSHNMYTSVFLLTGISFDRCISVLFPVWSQNRRGARLVCVACVVIWLLASFLSVPVLVFRDTAVVNGKIFCFSNFSLSENSSSLPGHPKLGSVGFRRHLVVNATRFLCGFLGPVLMITACYFTIVCKLRRNRMAKTKKPFRIIVTIILTFFLCWCPYQTLYLLELHHNAMPRSVFHLGLPLATAVAVANSCMNPILYAFMGQDFKKFRVAFFSRLVSALSEDSGLSSYPSHRSFTKMSSIHERSSKNEETNML